MRPYIALSIVASSAAVALTACNPIVLASGTGGSASSGNTVPGAGNTGPGTGSTGPGAGGTGLGAGGTDPGTSGTGADSSSGPGSGVVECVNGLCPFGGEGAPFSVAPGTSQGSHASLSPDNLLCLMGQVSPLPAGDTSPTFVEASGWGVGMGIYLNQWQPYSQPEPYQLTGTGITIDIDNLPDCTAARVVLTDQAGGPGYCATLTPGVEMPWSAFTSACELDPSAEPPTLTEAPTAVALEIVLVPNTQKDCSFYNFCITNLVL